MNSIFSKLNYDWVWCESQWWHKRVYYVLVYTIVCEECSRKYGVNNRMNNIMGTRVNWVVVGWFDLIWCVLFWPIWRNILWYDIVEECDWNFNIWFVGNLTESSRRFIFVNQMYIMNHEQHRQIWSKYTFVVSHFCSSLSKSINYYIFWTRLY